MGNDLRDAAFVSCDIVGHGKEHDHKIQEKRIEAINNRIKKVCGKHFGKDIVWASGGDGGHVAFFTESMREMAIRLIKALFLWAHEENEKSDFEFKLRLTAHYGPVSTIVGADERDQLVGDGINFCGSLLGFGIPDAVVVSSAFKNFINRARDKGDDLVNRIDFHDEQNVYLKHFQIHRIWLMSIRGDFESKKRSPEKSDHLQLDEACKENKEKLVWQIIYHAKRLQQIDSANKNAKMAIEMIKSETLFFKQFNKRGGSMKEIEIPSHPLFWPMNKADIRRYINAAHLVEREDGEVICKKGESGDTMFIVLKGQVGVVLNSDNDGDNEAEFDDMVDLRFGEGAILGELALALKCERTATLQAIGPTALLAINYKAHTDLLGLKPKKSDHEIPNTPFEKFLRGRLLEYLCRRVPYLSVDKNGPLAQEEEPWKIIVDHSNRFEFVRKDHIISTKEPPFDEPGLYILIHGELKMASSNGNVVKIFDGNDFPLLFIDIPDELVSVQWKYKIESDYIIIIRISTDVSDDLSSEAFSKIKQAAMLQLRSQFLFDAFISYDFEDKDTVKRWREKMEDADLNVYVSKPKAGEPFIEEIYFAIATSRVLLPLLTTHVLSADKGKSWVQKEIGIRLDLFDLNFCNILPVAEMPGIVEKVLHGISAISTSKGEGPAIDEAIKTIWEYRSGEKLPPYNLERVDLDDLLKQSASS